MSAKVFCLSNCGQYVSEIETSLRKTFGGIPVCSTETIFWCAISGISTCDEIIQDGGVIDDCAADGCGCGGDDGVVIVVMCGRCVNVRVM